MRFRSLFQFPSNGKVYLKIEVLDGVTRYTLPFQFPSNGKVYLKSFSGTYGYVLSVWVSIPFKRESVSQEGTANFRESKWHSKVSIPFKRESVSQGAFAAMKDIEHHLFQFPSNGKVYLKFSAQIRIGMKEIVGSFNSLQTGKCISRHRCNIKPSNFFGPVSIPFKRESVSQESVAEVQAWIKVNKSFNSLQTGKCISSSWKTA